MLIMLKLLHNTVVQWAIILAPMFAIALVVPVPGPWWVAWILGLAAALVVGYCAGVLQEVMYAKYTKAHPISEEDLEAARRRVVAKMNRWR